MVEFYEPKFLYDEDPYGLLLSPIHCKVRLLIKHTPPNHRLTAFQDNGLPSNSPSAAYLPFVGRSFASTFRHVPWPNAQYAEPPSVPSGTHTVPDDACQSSAKIMKIGSERCAGGDPEPPVQSLKNMVEFKEGILANHPQCAVHIKSEMEAYSEPGTIAQARKNCALKDPKPSLIQHGHDQELHTTRSSLKRNSSSTNDGDPRKKSASEASRSQTSSDNCSTSSSSNLYKTSSTLSNTLDEPGNPPPRVAKASHCQVERKYRENLNTKFETLRQAIPSMQSPSGDTSIDGRDFDDLSGPVKPRKADVLSNATDYVKQMEEKNRVMANEIDSLRSKITAMKTLIKCENCWLLNGVSGRRFDPQSGSASYGLYGGGEPFDRHLAEERFGDRAGGDKPDWMEQSPT